MVQVMNDRRFTTKVQRHLFELMNPYRCGVFDSKVKDPPPVIRMVFALASPESSVSIPSQRPTRNSIGIGRYTAYDIWCAGARGSTFAVIQEDEEDVLARFLKTLHEHREVANLYEDPWPESESLVNAIRTMDPGTSTHRSYFEQWFDLEDFEKEIELAEPKSE